MAGTDEALNEYESKSDLDFNRRLIAKFRIGRGRKFWGPGFDPIPRSALYPARDKIENICRQIAAPSGPTTSADIGNFLKEWSHLESFLLSQARSDQKRVMNTVDAISVIQSKGFLDTHIIENLNRLRILRNKVVHNPLQQGSGELKSATHELRLLTSKIQSAFDYILIAP